MSIVSLFLISISLSMDAFAVSVCKGMYLSKKDYKKIVIISLYFGLFQAIMPFTGYFLASSFSNVVSKVDHFIAFILLTIIGISMIFDSFNETEINDKTDFKTMFLFAIATSIDALVVGVTFAFLNVNIYFAVTLIGILTFVISFIGVLLGMTFKNKYGSKATIFGGITLILIGISILFSHLGII